MPTVIPPVVGFILDPGWKGLNPPKSLLFAASDLGILRVCGMNECPENATMVEVRMEVIRRCDVDLIMFFVCICDVCRCVQNYWQRHFLGRV